MHTFSNIGVAVALGAVTLVLVLGLANMLRGGASNTSQQLMRWRVGLLSARRNRFRNRSSLQSLRRRTGSSTMRRSIPMESWRRTLRKLWIA